MRSTLLVAGLCGLGLSSVAALSSTADPSNYSDLSPSPTSSLANLSPSDANHSPNSTPTHPCAVISAHQASASTRVIRVTAELAHDCLQSVPVDVEGDLKLIEELKIYLEWNSNTAFVKDPPRQFGYQEDPVDIMGSLDLIAQGIKNGRYKSEYDVQAMIKIMLTKTGDYHVNWFSDIYSVFQFLRPFTLTSVSQDGLNLPKVYIWEDFNKTYTEGGVWEPSDIQTINGKNVDDWISEYAFGEASYHDKDARYNQVLYDQAKTSQQYSPGLFRRGSGSYMGPYTNITFSNGTKTNFLNLAVTSQNFTDVVDAASFFDKFCEGPLVATPTLIPTPSATASKRAAASSVEETPTPTPTNYPPPVVYDDTSLAIGGYYLDKFTGYEDVAVLSIPAFSSDAGIRRFQNVTREFLANATSENKVKLIIDLRGNGGGYINAAYEVFMQLFPTTGPYGAGRYRAHNAFHILGEAITLLITNETLAQQLNATNSTLYEGAILGLNDFNYQVSTDINGGKFASFDEYFGPYTVHGDTFTGIKRPNFTYTSETELDLTGYGKLALNATNAKAPFAIDNMVLLQDGACGSACTIFSELMRTQGHVESIVFGGRPVYGPMQGIGGTKGSRLFPYSDIVQWAQGLLTITEALHEPTAAKINSTVIGTLAYPEQFLKRISYDEKGAPKGGVNGMDQLRMGDTTETPLQFHYEAADCRLFYTKAQVFDVTQVWRKVSDVRWGAAGYNGTCVNMSTGDPTSLSGAKALAACGTEGQPICSTGGARRVGVTWAVVVGLVVAMVL